MNIGLFKTEEPLFGLRLQNIPLINLRMEFSYHFKLLSDPTFCEKFPSADAPIQTEYLIWNGMPGDFLTLITQRAILGVESYLPGAVQHQAAKKGLLNQDFAKRIKNPFSLRGGSAVNNYYHCLPSLVDPSWSLKVADPLLWGITLRFYKEIRNPLFHGNQIDDPKVNGTPLLFQFIDKLYKWIDSWCPMEEFLSIEKSIKA